MRRSWVYIDGVAYEKGDVGVQARTQIVPDFDKPYKSMITGEMITSRAQHYEHLKRHNCQEVGNEVQAQMKYYERAKNQVEASQKQSRLALIQAQVDSMRHKDFKAAIKRDADRVKWNSRDG